MRSSFASLALGALILNTFAGVLKLEAAQETGASKLRGVTVSTHRGGQEWGSDAIGPTFDELRAVGANWVAIHPYARIDADGTVSFRPIDAQSPESPEVRPIREAHSRGLRILVKPHLAYWGSPFSWRGEIEFSEPESWRRFFDSYRSWIVALAEATREADAFSVGTELDRTLGHETQWREVIAAVRERTPAPLTYASNWTDYQRVPFWDALDAIGVQAYFPVADSDDPSEREIRRGWQERMWALHQFSERLDKYVVFTELGYNRSWEAARRPWEYQTDGPEAEVLQRRCLRIALDVIERERRVVGVFLWKWFPLPRSTGRDFQLAAPAMQAEIRRAWLGPVAGRPGRD